MYLREILDLFVILIPIYFQGPIQTSLRNYFTETFFQSCLVNLVVD